MNLDPHNCAESKMEVVESPSLKVFKRLVGSEGRGLEVDLALLGWWLGLMILGVIPQPKQFYGSNVQTS